MRILITGTAGQVGHALRDELAGLGELIAADRSVLDLSAPPEQIRARVRALAPQLIINPAAYTAVDRAEQEPLLAQAVNAVAPGALAEVAHELDCPLVHFSTDYVFDGLGQAPWQEDDPCQPLSVYGRTKHDGELAVTASGARHLVLRTSWVYSLGGRNFLATMARLAGERAELRVVDDQFGAPTTSLAIARATRALVTPLLAGGGPASGVYHLSCAGRVSWCGFARAIMDRLPRVRAALGMPPCAVPQLTPIGTADYPTPARRPANSVLSNRKLTQATGISLPHWEAALDDLLDTAG
jgi:dTDP-4-dehydrorhamnose reductase